MNYNTKACDLKSNQVQTNVKRLLKLYTQLPKYNMYNILYVQIREVLVYEEGVRSPNLPTQNTAGYTFVNCDTKNIYRNLKFSMWW